MEVDEGTLQLAMHLAPFVRRRVAPFFDQQQQQPSMDIVAFVHRVQTAVEKRLRALDDEQQAADTTASSSPLVSQLAITLTQQWAQVEERQLLKSPPLQGLSLPLPWEQPSCSSSTSASQLDVTREDEDEQMDIDEEQTTLMPFNSLSSSPPLNDEWDQQQQQPTTSAAASASFSPPRIYLPIEEERQEASSAPIDGRHRRQLHLNPVWAMCCNEQCGKWRQLRGCFDATAVAERWYCHMNDDAAYRSCEVPEEPCDDGSDEENFGFIESQFSVGSVVWALAEGFKNWAPAIVSPDPDEDLTMQTVSSQQPVVASYHVVFFGRIAQRAWISVDKIRAYDKFQPTTSETAARISGSRGLTKVELRRVKTQLKRNADLARSFADVAFNIKDVERRLHLFGQIEYFKSMKGKKQERRLKLKRTMSSMSLSQSSAERGRQQQRASEAPKKPSGRAQSQAPMVR